MSARKPTIRVKDEDDEDQASGFHVDLGGMIFLLIVLYILLFLYGSSVRGITKFIERDSVEQGHAPSSLTYALWFVLNSVLFGIPGFIMNLAVPDVFEGLSVIRENKAFGLAHAVHDSHFHTGQPQPQPQLQQTQPQPKLRPR